MNTQPTELLTTDEKRAWLASIFRDQSGYFTAADKLKALEADTRLALIKEPRTASPENGIKNTETAPKNDQNRKFRKGDKVRVVEWNGRNYYDIDHGTKLETGCLAEIWEDEEDEQLEGYVSVIYQGYIRSVPPCYLELVTPVEEIAPYFVEKGQISFRLKKGDKLLANYWPSHPNAQAAAEAECDRLNAEYRKEQE